MWLWAFLWCLVVCAISGNLCFSAFWWLGLIRCGFVFQGCVLDCGIIRFLVGFGCFVCFCSLVYLCVGAVIWWSRVCLFSCFVFRCRCGFCRFCCFWCFDCGRFAWFAVLGFALLRGVGVDILGVLEYFGGILAVFSVFSGILWCLGLV